MKYKATLLFNSVIFEKLKLSSTAISLLKQRIDEKKIEQVISEDQFHYLKPENFVFQFIDIVDCSMRIAFR